MPKSLICKLKTVWYNLRYIHYGLLEGMILSGHEFQSMNETRHDHWMMKCKRCGIEAAIEVDPEGINEGD